MVSSSATQSPATSTKHRYIPRGRNQLHTIFERHFDEFCDVYDERCAATYGMFRLDRIRDIGERFLTCGDYRLGVARIRCTNPTCGHDNFRPFSCKGFYLCPSCSQWLLAKVYEIDPLVCPKCGCEMKIIAVIQDSVEIRDILTHLVNVGRAPPGFDPALLN